MSKADVERAGLFAERSRAYRLVLAHRRTCKKWSKEFCLQCFGGGLLTFTKELEVEKTHLCRDCGGPCLDKRRSLCEDCEMKVFNAKMSMRLN